MTTLIEKPAYSIAEMIRSQEVTSEEYVSLVLDRIKKVEPEIHAFITVVEEQALKEAKRIDASIKNKEKIGSLAGIPVAIKDVISTSGIETTCGSRILQGYIPPYDATVVERLKQAGAIIIGKTNTDEFAMGTTTEFSAFGSTKNPKDKTRVPGGSSGGSAAAVASKEVPLSLGSDTGGSVRCPASFCGVVGLKPTYGLVSRFGLISYANSLEQIGPLAANTCDCAMLLKCIEGWDPLDSTSSTKTIMRSETVNNLPKSTKIAVPKEFFAEGTDDLVVKEVWRAIYRLGDACSCVEEASLKSLEYALPAYYIIAMAEASSNLARYDGLRYGLHVKSGFRDWSSYFTRNRGLGFGSEVKRRIMLGTYILSAGYYGAYYLKAQKIRTKLVEEFERIFKDYDLVAGPTMPTQAFNIGEKAHDPLLMYMCDVDTVPANLTGLPAISVPTGMTNLPVGLQLMAPRFKEDRLFQAARVVEQRSGI